MMGDALAAAIEAMEQRDPAQAATACGFAFEETGAGDGGDAAIAHGGVIRASFLGGPVDLAVPGFDQVAGDPLPPHVRAILVYHLATSDGTEPDGTWTAFTELPDGRFYVNAWRGYTGKAIVRELDDDIDIVRSAAERLGGEAVDLPGDVAVRLDVFPRVPVAFVYWAGDDEFEPRADFLFDVTAGRHLATDCLAVCCSWITHCLVRAASERRQG